MLMTHIDSKDMLIKCSVPLFISTVIITTPIIENIIDCNFNRFLNLELIELSVRLSL